MIGHDQFPFLLVPSSLYNPDSSPAILCASGGHKEITAGTLTRGKEQKENEKREKRDLAA